MPVPDKLISMMDDVATAKISREGSGLGVRAGERGAALASCVAMSRVDLDGRHGWLLVATISRECI